MSDMTLPELREHLKAAKGRLRQIERETGVNYATIRAIRDGESVNPRVDHYSALARYFGAKNVPVQN